MDAPNFWNAAAPLWQTAVTWLAWTWGTVHDSGAQNCSTECIHEDHRPLSQKCRSPVIACSHRRHRQDKTVLYCPCRRREQNWRQEKTVSCFDPVSNLQLFSLIYIEDYWKHGNWKLGRDKTNCLVVSPMVFTTTTVHGQDKLSVSAVWSCEQAITDIACNGHQCPLINMLSIYWCYTDQGSLYYWQYSDPCTDRLSCIHWLYRRMLSVTSVDRNVFQHKRDRTPVIVCNDSQV